MTNQQFKSCFDSYFDAIRNYIYYRSGDAELATDIAQDVFLKLWEKQLKLDENHIKGLLYKMAGNQLIDFFRKKKTNEDYLSNLVFEFKTNQGEEAIDYQELKTQYEKSLAQLPEKQRTVFLMNRIDGLTYNEIAKRLEVSVKTVEKRISQTLSKLRKAIVFSILMIGILCGCNKPCNEVEINPIPICACNKNYKPVCGCNETTYSNCCIAECQGISTYVEGTCN